jgi:hypothetical protein
MREWACEKAITSTQEEESEAWRRVAGAEVVGQVQPKEWSVPNRPGARLAVYGKAKGKWEV